MIGAIAATIIGVIGYHFIHKFNKIGTWFMGGSLLIGLLIMLPHINAEVLAKVLFNMKGWFAMLADLQKFTALRASQVFLTVMTEVVGNMLTGISLAMVMKFSLPQILLTPGKIRILTWIR